MFSARIDAIECVGGAPGWSRGLHVSDLAPVLDAYRRIYCCSRCLGSGNECTYSKRRSPHSQQQQQRQQQTHTAGMNPANVHPHSTSGAVLADGMGPFKRYICHLRSETSR